MVVGISAVPEARFRPPSGTHNFQDSVLHSIRLAEHLLECILHSADAICAGFLEADLVGGHQDDLSTFNDRDFKTGRNVVIMVDGHAIR